MLTENHKRQLNEEGFCIFPAVLSSKELEKARAALDCGVEHMRQVAGSTYDPRLDPNDANLRVYDLPAIDPFFIELLRRDDALETARQVLGEALLISNFTANIALPGSGSMRLHSDQALLVPAPWLQPWSVNVIWCLDDVHAANGATRYVPGSHRFRNPGDVPNDALDHMRAFEAPAGSFIVMEGRLWHTSGCNVTVDEQRRILFAYYSCDFIRPQANWNAVLPQDVQDGLDDQMRKLFVLGPKGNTRVGGRLTKQ